MFKHVGLKLSKNIQLISHSFTAEQKCNTEISKKLIRNKIEQKKEGSTEREHNCEITINKRNHSLIRIQKSNLSCM